MTSTSEDKSARTWCVDSVPLLRKLSDDVREMMMRDATERHFAKGEYIFFPSDAAKVGERVYLIKDGSVTLYRNGEGKRITLQSLSTGAIFGGFGFVGSGLEDGPRDGNFAVCDEESTVCVLTKKDFLAILQRCPEIALEFMEEMARRMRVLEGRFRDLALLDAHARIVNELTRLGKALPKGAVRVPRITHERLGERVGLTREAVTRTISAMRDAQELRTDPESGEFLLIRRSPTP